MLIGECFELILCKGVLGPPISSHLRSFFEWCLGCSQERERERGRERRYEAHDCVQFVQEDCSACFKKKIAMDRHQFRKERGLVS